MNGPKLEAVAIFRRRSRHGVAAPQHGVDAGQQLARRERLAEVVVRADLQADDAVDLVAAGGEQDDGHIVVAGPQIAQGREAIDLGHHQIKYDQRRALALEARGQAVTVMQHRHGKALLGQVFAQQVAQFDVVIDDQDLGAAHLSGGRWKVCS